MRWRTLPYFVRSGKSRSLALTACAVVLVVICCLREENSSDTFGRPGLEMDADLPEESTESSKIVSRNVTSDEYVHEESDLLDDDSSPAAVPGKTYLAPLFSSEQMMNTIASFVDLCRIAVDWNASLVEPHICASRLYGLYGLHDHWCPHSEKMYPYRTFYDLEQLKDMLACTKPRRCGLAPYEDFLQHSHRQLVILHALAPTPFKHFRAISEEGSLLASETKQDTLVKCNGVFPSLAERVATHLNVRSKAKNLPHFSTPLILCWNKAETVTSQSVLAGINHYLGPDSQNRFSVFFTTYSARQPEPDNQSFREKFASDAVVARHCQPRLLHSAPKLQMLATAFLADLGLKGDQYVSIHIRIEKLVKLLDRNQTRCCLNALNSTVQSVKKMYSHNTQFLVITDISPYGTDTCSYDGCLKPAQAALEELKRMGLKPTHFHPLKYSNYTSNTVAGIVESEALCRGRNLITAGTGLFQGALINQYLTYQLATANSNQRIQGWYRHVFTVCRSSLTLPSSVVNPKKLKSRITRNTSCL